MREAGIAQTGSKVYSEDEFYVKLAFQRSLGAQDVVRRSRRRRHACIRLGVAHGHINLLRLDNPFMYSHAWKFMVRESLRLAKTRMERKAWRTQSSTAAKN